LAGPGKYGGVHQIGAQVKSTTLTTPYVTPTQDESPIFTHPILRNIPLRFLTTIELVMS